MRLVATLTTGTTVHLACPTSALEHGTILEIAEEMDRELPWVETSDGTWIRRDAIIALHLDHEGAAT